MISIRKLYNSFMNKSIKQRIIICIVITAMFTLLFFAIKANFFDVPLEAEEAEQADRPQFHISLIDMGLLAVVIIAYIIHKIREKRKQKRM